MEGAPTTTQNLLRNLKINILFTQTGLYLRPNRSVDLDFKNAAKVDKIKQEKNFKTINWCGGWDLNPRTPAG